jgi:predicted NAD/FAD-binding protein
MRIAIIGTGISGMVAAYLLHSEHDVTLFEANDYIGGHTNTIGVETAEGCYAVDTGFMVFNDRTYPHFSKLLTRLGVASQPSTMSFSLRCEDSGLEYNGTSINTLFAQRRNLIRPAFHRMWLDIVRFNAQASRLLEQENHHVTLGEYLAASHYSTEFIEHYIVPMGAAIWSADPQRLRGFPLHFFLRFFHNHGMLSVNQRPQWRVISGGSRQYVKALTRPYADRIRLTCPVQSISRARDHVVVKPRGGEPERFDHVILATHSDQALALLADPTEMERDILSALPYQENAAILHTDASLLPRRRRAWASWNYHRLRKEQESVAVTYNLNMLQSLASSAPFCVTLNRLEAVDPAKIIQRFTYHHPTYTPQAAVAQQQHARISGVERTHFCGAYWGYGFHEDGVNSALAVVQSFGKSL